jgi:hypothetical protein
MPLISTRPSWSRWAARCYARGGRYGRRRSGGAGSCTATTSAVERGEVNPTFRVLLKLERGLGVPLSELIDLFEAHRAQRSGLMSARRAPSRRQSGEARRPAYRANERGRGRLGPGRGQLAVVSRRRRERCATRLPRSTTAETATKTTPTKVTVVEWPVAKMEPLLSRRPALVNGRSSQRIHGYAQSREPRSHLRIRRRMLPAVVAAYARRARCQNARAPYPIPVQQCEQVVLDIYVPTSPGLTGMVVSGDRDAVVCGVLRAARRSREASGSPCLASVSSQEQR